MHTAAGRGRSTRNRRGDRRLDRDERAVQAKAPHNPLNGGCLLTQLPLQWEHQPVVCTTGERTPLLRIGGRGNPMLGETPNRIPGAVRRGRLARRQLLPRRGWGALFAATRTSCEPISSSGRPFPHCRSRRGRTRARSRWRRDLDHIAQFETKVERKDWRGLAIFGCAARHLWQVHPWVRGSRPIPVAKSAAIRPLATLINDYPRCAVALVDRKQARLFLLEGGGSSNSSAWRTTCMSNSTSRSSKSISSGR